MCFWIHDEHKKAIISTKDIRCWKITYKYKIHKDGFTSSVQAFRYKFNKTYKTTLGIYDRNITRGFHSYSKKPYSTLYNKIIYCIIPKGSKYYYNPSFDEYVSNYDISNDYIKLKYNHSYRVMKLQEKYAKKLHFFIFFVS